MMRTENVARWLEAAERQVAEPIEAIAIGAGGAVTRSEGLAALDHDFSNDFGETGCQPIYAWSKSFVFFVAEYEGAVQLRWVPRSPSAGAPEFDGTSLDPQAD
ncbi:hypothetical protein KQX64_07195 [Rhodopseudomonas palustris]|nr:hypothetical protein KQX64_07195 [Rhodopseudomonas palustris]